MNALTIEQYLKLKEGMGEKLYAYRKKFNITQKRMGEMLACHPTYISQIERKIRPPSDDILRKILRIMEE